MYSLFQVKLSFINTEKIVLIVSSKIYIKSHQKKKVKYQMHIYLCEREREREREREFSFIPCSFGKKIAF